jgi:putative oxygen-independent coproporphyrinogen III oxidase
MSTPVKFFPTRRAAAAQSASLSALPPLSLYIHLPWCIKKCPYCDFNSHEHAEVRVPEERYLEALQRDLEAALPLIWGRPIYSVFIGGGTPSLFSPEAIGALMASVRARTKLMPDAEITLEANPGTFEIGRFAGFRRAGINRLSIGVQSFDDDKLKALGRVHDGDQAHAAVTEAAQQFDTFNLDLMYALPEQSLAQCEADLEAALSYSPPHLSLYHLTLEPNTLFAKFPPKVADEDSAAQMQDLLEARTRAAGYEHYEISAYAKPNHRAWHNFNYWSFGDYLGIGAGAHSKLSFHDKIIRQARFKHPERYMSSADPTEINDEVRTDALAFEFMLNALRLTEGFDATLFTERTSLPLTSIERELREAEAKGLLERAGGKIKPTPRGLAFLSDLQELFLSA